MIDPVVQKQIDLIREKCKTLSPLVAIDCLTYNHDPYLQDALDGFLMQKTNFPFVVIVHDDASTDKTREILKEYAEKYPDIIFPILETENQYSKQDGSLNIILNKSFEATGAKYIALCEGDDYWIDPFKLQKQVSFLENHPDYSLCVSNLDYLYPDGQKKPSPFNTATSCDLNIKDVILEGGMYIGTPTIVTLTKYFLNLPYANKNLHVGDYPLQIYLAGIGKVRNLADITSVYRSNSVGSWTSRLSETAFDYNARKDKVDKESFLIDTMNEVTGYTYSKIFHKRKNLYRYLTLLPFSPVTEFKFFLKTPALILRKCSLKKIIYSFLPESYKLKKANKDK